jgi:UDP-N-acetylglucosamine 2-epimerase (non-hydrolysing)
MEFNAGSGLTLLDPLGYLDFLCLMSRSSIVLTDSGGIQEETTALGVPCLTLRNNTERPVTIEEGTNILAGTTPESILQAWEHMNANPKAGRVPKYWEGAAVGRCLVAIHEFFAKPG